MSFFSSFFSAFICFLPCFEVEQLLKNHQKYFISGALFLDEQIPYHLIEGKTLKADGLKLIWEKSVETA
jgi:hypothetical protein